MVQRFNLVIFYFVIISLVFVIAFNFLFFSLQVASFFHTHFPEGRIGSYVDIYERIT